MTTTDPAPTDTPGAATPAGYDSRADTLLHSLRVGALMVQIGNEISTRSVQHDLSKTQPPEVSYFDEMTPKLGTVVYGSPQYDAFLVAMKPALDHHYRLNRHHPEHGETNLEWRPIPGYQGHYEISSFGDVRSVTRPVSRSGPTGDLVVPGKVKKAFVTPKGYLRTQLVKGGQAKNFMVHRLVATAFLDNPENLPEVNHRDGNKKNNQISNLEWATECDNQIHAYDGGLREPAVKYIVHCPELGITTLGCVDMAKAVQAAGYSRVSSSGVWSAVDRGGKHYNLTFEGTLLAEYRRSRIRGMNLVDLIEMLADWKASTERTLNGDLRRSIMHNADRFGYGDELRDILLSTAEFLGWIDPAGEQGPCAGPP